MNHSHSGVLATILAYSIWGLLPIYWKSIETVPALEILCHRMTWSLLFLFLMLTLQKRWNLLQEVKKHPKHLFYFLGTASLLALNWYTYIWAVNSGYIIESSLGYFINPLVTIVLGMLFLRERLRRGQWIAISIALMGVLYLTFSYGTFPWIALILALTFGAYGLLRKTGVFNALDGLTIETLWLFLPALCYLLYLEADGTSTFGHTSWSTSLLLAVTGAATATPLLFFAYGAQRVSMATLGVLHYIAPTSQFLLGVFVYEEPFELTRLIGFSTIWLALLIYTIESLFWMKTQPG
ncbi:MAG: EamA family transporter RarD [SAR324 cluster bacterium]|nr:EamA family transporter RarD [SAR324 cluster bacterium]